MDTLRFIEAIGSLQFENTFNPYAQRCPVHDLDDAPSRRRSALHAILNVAVQTTVDSLWIARDLGFRGGRRTGLALTDDIHMHAHAERWRIPISRPTHGQLVPERTAGIVWSVLSQIDVPVFLWNVFPLHPHESSQPFSNRSHTAQERRAGEEVLAALMELLRPRRIVAIGNEAASSVRRFMCQAEVVQVRHPSYGGQTEFLHAVRDLYSIPARGTQSDLF